MRKAEVEKLLLKCAEVSWKTEFVIIGSQAIHGTLADPSIDAVVRSPDLDFYPKAGYSSRNSDYEAMMREVGQDSTYHEETGTFIEAVSTTLARFPSGWEDRTTREVIGSIEVAGGEKREVAVIYPEIHDLTVAKLAIGREKDLEFLQGVIELKLVDKDLLKERYRQAPRTENDRIVDGLAQIDEAFDRRARGDCGRRGP